MQLTNKSILVVGSGGLLGQEVVRAIVREGGRVAAADVNRQSLAPLVSELGSEKILPLDIDITEKTSIEKAFSQIEEKWRHLDGAVNAAYPKNENYGRKAFDVTYEDFCENVGLHLGGYFLFMQRCAEYAQRSDIPFSLVNLSSIYGVIAPRFDIYEDTEMTTPVEYAAIKSSIIHLNSYFTSLMKGSRFRVNAVSPGGLLNNQDERFLEAYKSYSRSVGMLSANDVVGSINFLLSDQSEFVCGQNIIVDDGFSS